jgi:hypothetical protein
MIFVIFGGEWGAQLTSEIRYRESIATVVGCNICTLIVSL